MNLEGKLMTGPKGALGTIKRISRRDERGVSVLVEIVKPAAHYKLGDRVFWRLTEAQAKKLEGEAF